jgi:transaldolase
MSLYLDSAILKEATTAADSGWIYGITTNPTILAKSEFPAEETLKKLSALPVEEVYCQVEASTLAEMQKQAGRAKEIIGEKLVVKIPPTKVGYQFAAQISENQKTCITAIFSPAQALVAREAGADYIAIYVNRATRLLGDGNKLVRESRQVLERSKTEILAASLKSPEEVVGAALAGAHHLTLPFDVLQHIPDHPLSKEAVRDFAENGTFLKG